MARRKTTPAVRLQEPADSRKVPFKGITTMRDAFERAGMEVRGRIGTWTCSGWRVLRDAKQQKRGRRKRHARKRSKAAR